MNAGLLGEHLASPRTATKTHQSTALDSSTAAGGESSPPNEFAALVRQDKDVAPPPKPETNVSDYAAIASPDGTVFEGTVKLQPDNATDLAIVSDDAMQRSVSAAQLADAEPRARGNPSIDADATLAPSSDNVVANERATPAVTAPEQALPASEFVSRDPRVRAQDSAANEVSRDTRGQSAAPVLAEGEAVPVRTSSLAGDAESRLPAETGTGTSLDADRAETELARTPTRTDQLTSDVRETQFRQTASGEASALDRLTSGGTPRELAVINAEPVTNFGAATTTPTSSTITTPSGLTPTAPALPLATPTELSNIIINAVNNGVDPQEQLVVQLDPPELGRVMIDFKFDAQGLQQIVVTTENPEALKRLRELHFELTQALREHGLSEQSMTFEQHSGEHAQDAWRSPDQTRQDRSFVAAEQRSQSSSATLTEPRARSRDQLDLLL